MLKTRTCVVGCILSGALALAGCKKSTPAPTAAEGTAQTASAATIVVPLQAKSDSKLTGKAELTDTGAGVKVRVEVAGIAPGKHGVHVHEKADCSAPDATSAGSHFNPENQPHALPPTSPRHLGDLGNIEVGADGTGVLEAEVPGANLKAGDPSSFRERAIIVHANLDDGGQPVGNAGGRIGCAEIR